MNPEDQQTDYNQPVAYDAKGRPLYAHPPQSQPMPHVVHMSRAVEPIKPKISQEAKRRHEQSKRQFPTLNLSEGEYVITAVGRHPIGLIIPLGIGILIITIALSIALNYAAFADFFAISGAAANPDAVFLPILLFCVLIGLGMFVVYYVYTNNKFFLTNESVIQEIQVSLFSRLEQTVSLANVEDASYSRHGILQHVFNYGSIRLSTEGDETTYRFTYVANPKLHIATLNNAVEAFKNGRPVQGDD